MTQIISHTSVVFSFVFFLCSFCYRRYNLSHLRFLKIVLFCVHDCTVGVFLVIFLDTYLGKKNKKKNMQFLSSLKMAAQVNLLISSYQISLPACLLSVTICRILYNSVNAIWFSFTPVYCKTPETSGPSRNLSMQ